jgi:hypothetical protein
LKSYIGTITIDLSNDKDVKEVLKNDNIQSALKEDIWREHLKVIDNGIQDSSVTFTITDLNEYVSPYARAAKTYDNTTYFSMLGKSYMEQTVIWEGLNTTTSKYKVNNEVNRSALGSIFNITIMLVDGASGGVVGMVSGGVSIAQGFLDATGYQLPLTGSTGDFSEANVGYKRTTKYVSIYNSSVASPGYKLWCI